AATMGIVTPLLLAAFVATATAVPTGLRYNCASTCGEASKFAFQRGMSYEYDYKVMTDVATGVETEVARTDVEAKAIVSVLAPCEYSLSLENVVLDGSHSSEFSSQ
ncbi:Lipid transport protein beta-sheet shell, partial [Trinorchestia longiramus]